MTVKQTPLCLLSLLLLFAACRSRTEADPVQIDYPGSPLAADTAEVFAAGILSTDAYEHSAPAISPDGKTIVWSVIELPSWRSSIREINYEQGQWTAPHLASFNDTSCNNIYPSFSPGAPQLFFSSDKKIAGDTRTSRGNVLWRVEKTADGWSVPQPLDSMISRGGDYAPGPGAKGDLYFTHGAFQSPDWNIMLAENAGREAPKPLRAINTGGYEDGAFISPDGSYLIFESDRAGGIAGSIDLYICFKLGDDTWSEPLNMGEKINTKAAERFARVSPDGRFFFFGSNRRQLDGQPNFDIYWIKASVIGDLRKQAGL